MSAEGLRFGAKALAVVLLILAAGAVTSCTLPDELATSSYGSLPDDGLAGNPTFTLAPTTTLRAQVELPYQAVWRCGTPTSVPTSCSRNSEGTITSCTAIQPTATTYVLLNDFPLGKHIQVGPIGQSGLGLWVWIDKVDIYTLPDDGVSGKAWAAVWEINAENASIDTFYEFNPTAQAYVYEVTMEDGTTKRGQYLPNFEVMGYLNRTYGLDFPVVGEQQDAVQSLGSNYLSPNTRETVRLAAAVPGDEVLRLAYTFLPNGQSSVNQDSGGNEAIWYTKQDDGDCPSEVTPGPGGIPAPPIVGSFRLARWPVNGAIVRGFGCTTEFTGEQGSSCPSGQPWFHNGIDIAVGSGTSIVDVFADNAAIVYAGEDVNGNDCTSLAGAQDPKFGLGNYILQNGIVDGSTVSVYYGHLSGLSVNSLDTTTPGKIIGQSGSTGCSTAPHLHFAVVADGNFVDPMTVLP